MGDRGDEPTRRGIFVPIEPIDIDHGAVTVPRLQRDAQGGNRVWVKRGADLLGGDSPCCQSKFVSDIENGVWTLVTPLIQVMVICSRRR